MLLKDFFPNIDKKFQNFKFSGIAFNSKKLKKIIFFLQLKGLKLMAKSILMKQ